MTARDMAKQAIQKAQKPGTMKGLKADDVSSIFKAYRAQISQALPKHLTADRVIQMATTLISRSPELAECSTESLVGATMQSSILGFQPVAALGQCYFVPFHNKKTGKREVQFIIGYKGMIELARRSGEIQTIYAQVVYENDEFTYELGLEPKLVHVPDTGERGKMTHVYAVAKFTGGGFAFEVMSKSDVDKIKNKSQAGNSSYSPWNSGFYDEMARKTVVRRLFKYLPVSVEYQKDVLTDESTIKPDAFADGEVDLGFIEQAEIVDTETGEIKEVEAEAETVLEQGQRSLLDDEAKKA